MGFLTELQSRIPDRWFFQRLLPAAVYVVLVVVCGGQLGYAHWDRLDLARARLAAGLRVSGSSAPQAAASLVLFATAIAVCAFAVPVAAAAIDALVSGAWPWWLLPLGLCVLKIRRWYWASRESHQEKAIRLRRRGGVAREARAVRQDWLAAAADAEPKLYTWSADRFETTRENIRSSTGQEITERWTDLLLVMPEAAQAILTAARDSYDGACEALVWSAALFVLGGWWWPAALIGLLLAYVAWRWLRRSVTGLCDAAEAAARVYAGQLK